MSKTIHYSLISEPHLLDLVDEEWRKDKLPDDSKSGCVTDMSTTRNSRQI